MSDKRTTKRSATIYYLRLSDIATGFDYGRVVDISAEGLLITTEKPHQVPEQFVAYVQVPPGSSGGTGFSCSLTRKWSRQDTGPNLTLIGFSMKADPKSEPLINELIERYSFGRDIRPIEK